MRLEQWCMKNNNLDNVLLAPQNDCTINVMSFLRDREFSCLGYVDSFKQGDTIIEPAKTNESTIILIYSPNYWQEIIANTPKAQHFVLIEKDHDIQVIAIEDFDGNFPEMNFNSLISQKFFWEKHLQNYLDDGGDIKDYGFTWGDPEKTDDELGNYASISQELLTKISSTDHVLELGSLSGKWTKYLLHAKHVTCVDINTLMQSVISKRYQQQLHKISFYLSKGSELGGVEDNSVNFLFCIDTLVRSSEAIVVDYIDEIYRVLVQGGTALIHLPCARNEQCVDRGFTLLDIEGLSVSVFNQFSHFNIDRERIRHGVLVRLTK